MSTETEGSGGPVFGAFGDVGLPFCGDEYPPLKGSPGAVICSKPSHLATEIHLNEETGWVWRTE